ncbi:Ribonuclease H2 subunit A [Hondaea fermentalgiana]|uniref:Ribonuclease n=1 Tax=Hondaea fermentalgiana TaxID=2315210 RepID=A0A2R5GP60_9STRA|nr:Ribonuclease H2 subunit A [Hondaea fermentalgiana]|eukprot:GBG29664.1 Ribonuclease H2 subunit A [Hondaea fermentalgiana]
MPKGSGFVETEFGLQLEEDEEEEEEEVVASQSQSQSPSQAATQEALSGDENDDASHNEDKGKGKDVEKGCTLEAKSADEVAAKLDAIFHVSPVPDKCKDGVPCILGIDEAGRGPVLGPMVYGAAYWPKSEADSIDKLGFNDSKQLKETDRDRFFGILEREKDRIGHVICDLSAEHISANMLLRTPVSLNVISHSTAIEMIKRVRAQGVNVAEIYVDAVGNCEWYEKRLAKIFPHAQVTVRAKADAIYKVVGAASIYAKVTRDRALRDWVFREHYDAQGQPLRRKRQLEELNCSGYPSDERTVAWLRKNADPVFGFPSVVRFSWKTARSMLGEHEEEMDTAERARLEKMRAASNMIDFVKVDWETAGERQGMVSLASTFKPGRSSLRPKYFRDRRMHAVSSF